jgi:hypothetical protein
MPKSYRFLADRHRKFAVDSASGTVTDAEGNFRLYVPDSLNRADITLVCTFVGYNVKEFRVTDNGPLTIELNPQATMLTGDVVITCMRKATFRERMKARWKRLCRK